MPRQFINKQNSIAYSETPALYTSNELNRTDGIVNPISGLTNAYKLAPTAVSAQHYISIPINGTYVVANGFVTFSTLAKSEGQNWLRLQLGFAGGNTIVYYDVLNGVVGTKTDGGMRIIDASISPYVNSYASGWYMVNLTVQMLNGKQAGICYMSVCDTNGVDTMTGDGTSGIAVFAYQVVGADWRGDYQPTNGAPVLNPIRNLIKKQNLVAFSEDISADTQTAMVPTYNSGLDIYGNMTADRITDNATASFHGVTKSCSAATVTGVYAFSAFVRPIAGCSFTLIASDGTSGAGVVIDGATLALVGTTSTGSGATYLKHSVEASANGLYRVQVAVNFTIKAPTTISVLVNKAKITSWGWSYSGTGDSIEVWGWQVNKGYNADGYQPTTGTPASEATRNVVDKQNFVQWSRDISNHNSGGGVSVATNSGMDIDGGTTMARFTDTAVNEAHYIKQLYATGDTGGVYTASAYFRPINGCSFTLAFDDGVVGNGVTWDGSDFSFVGTSAGGGGATILDYGIDRISNRNGLVRAHLTVLFATRTPINIMASVNKNKVLTWGWVYTGTGSDSVEIGDLQVVKANWAGDYALTNGTQRKLPTRSTATSRSAVKKTPTDIGSCLFWLAADQGISLDGSNKVQQWNDISGNNKHFTQATAGSRPGYGASLVNGKPALVFTNLNDEFLYNGATGFSGGSAAHTLFVVMRMYSAPNSSYTGVVSLGGNVPAASTSAIGHDSSNKIWGGGSGFASPAAAETITTGKTYTLIKTSTGQFDSLNSGGSPVAGALQAAVYAIAPAQDAYIGRYTSTGGADDFYVCEVAAFGKEITQNDINALATYAMEKWGV